MKTIAFKNNGPSDFIFEDAVEVVLMFDSVQAIFPSSMTLNIGNHGSDVVNLYENVTPPEDWLPHKYLFDGNTWTPNPESPYETAN